MAYLDIECMFYQRELATRKSLTVSHVKPAIKNATPLSQEAEKRRSKTPNPNSTSTTQYSDSENVDKDTRYPILLLTRFIRFITSLRQAKRDKKGSTSDITKSTVLTREDSFNEKIAMLFAKDNLQFYLHLENRLSFNGKSLNTEKKQNVSLTADRPHSNGEENRKKQNVIKTESSGSVHVQEDVNKAGTSGDCIVVDEIGNYEGDDNKTDYREDDTKTEQITKPKSRLKVLEQGFFAIFHRPLSKESEQEHQHGSESSDDHHIRAIIENDDDKKGLETWEQQKQQQQQQQEESTSDTSSISLSPTHALLDTGNARRFRHDVSTSPFQAVRSFKHTSNENDMLSDDSWMTASTDFPWANKPLISPSNDENTVVVTTLTVDEGDKFVDIQPLEKSPQSSEKEDLQKPSDLQPTQLEATTGSSKISEEVDLQKTSVLQPLQHEATTAATSTTLNNRTNPPLIFIEVIKPEVKIDDLIDNLPDTNTSLATEISDSPKRDLPQVQQAQALKTVVLSQKLVAHSSEVVDLRASSPFESIEFGFNRDRNSLSDAGNSPINIALSDGWTSKSSSPFENISITRSNEERSSPDSPFEDISFD